MKTWQKLTLAFVLIVLIGSGLWFSLVFKHDEPKQMTSAIEQRESKKAAAHREIIQSSKKEKPTANELEDTQPDTDSLGYPIEAGYQEETMKYDSGPDFEAPQWVAACTQAGHVVEFEVQKDNDQEQLVKYVCPALKKFGYYRHEKKVALPESESSTHMDEEQN